MSTNQKVYQIGHVFAKIKNREIIGTVHSVFSKNINLYFENFGLITLCSSDIPMSPLHGKTRISDFDNLKIEHDPRIFIKDNKIYLSQVIFDFSKSESYKSPLARNRERNTPGLASKGEINAILYKIINMVKKNNQDGFIPLLPYTLDMCRGLKQSRLELPVFASQGYYLINELASYLWKGDFSLLLETAIHLIGLGPGLTPSGDDFLSGFMIGYFNYLKFLNRDSLLAREVFPLIAKRSLGQTNYLSYQQLLLASTGAGNEIVEQLCLDILQADLDGVLLQLDNIINIGSTSGVDQLIGLLFGIGALASIKNL